MRRGWYVFLSVFAVAGCHWVLPFEDRASEAGAGDASQFDLAGDGPADDGPVADLGPDSRPWFDGAAGNTCTSFWLDYPPVQLSDEDAHSAWGPSIVAVGGDFFVAFVEQGNIIVKKVSPFSTNVAATKVQLNGAGLKADAPWITFDGKQTLGVVWHEEVNVATSQCTRSLHLREVDTATEGLKAECVLSSGLTTPYDAGGFGPASLVHDGTSYLLATPYHWYGVDCYKHMKGETRLFQGCQPITGTPYKLGPANWNPLVAVSAGGSAPYLLLRQLGPDANVSPTEVTLELYSSSNGTSWSAVSWADTVEKGLPDRPALADDGSGAFVAWTTTLGNIKVRFRSNAGDLYSPLALNGGSGQVRGPFLAPMPQANLTALVYTDLAAVGPQRISISALGKTGTAVTSLASGVVYSGPTGPAADTYPRTAVVAAGSNGFGVAWVHEPVLDQSEVFFKWVGCLP